MIYDLDKENLNITGVIISTTQLYYRCYLNSLKSRESGIIFLQQPSTI